MTRFLRWAEVTIGAALTAAALYLHSIYWKSAGPFWRDEVDSLLIPRTPWPKLMWRMQFDSFPLFWMLLVRGWENLFGQGVQSMRTLGVLTGVLLLAAMWFALRTFGVRAPMLAIGLAGATATVVRYGDSLRAYGFSAVIGLVSLTLLYRTVKKPNVLNFVLAGLASLAAANTTYHNAQLLFACCVATAILHVVAHKSWRNAILTLGIGGVCAASLLIYLPTMRLVKQWSGLVRYDVDLAWILKKFAEAADLGGGIGARGWLISLVIALLLAGLVLWRKRDQWPLLYCSLVLVIYTIAQIGFLLNLGFLMQPWYFLLWICVAAVLIDAMIAIPLDREPALQLIRGAAAFFMVLLAFDGAKEIAAQRTTNLDLIAATLQREATPRDFILVYPWHLGCSFNLYYRGQTPWNTLPPLPEQSVQRYDEASKAITDMRERPLIERVVQTLRNGGRVWYVGYPLYLEQAVYVHEETKMNPRVEADNRWSRELQDALRAEQVKPAVVMQPDADISPLENASLLRVDPVR